LLTATAPPVWGRCAGKFILKHSASWAWRPFRAATINKKADVVEHPDEVFDHVGLLVNKPPGMTGVPFI
jgi:hypothetical protein